MDGSLTVFAVNSLASISFRKLNVSHKHYQTLDETYLIRFIAPPLFGHKQHGGESIPLEHGLHNQLPSGMSGTP